MKQAASDSASKVMIEGVIHVGLWSWLTSHLLYYVTTLQLIEAKTELDIYEEQCNGAMRKLQEAKAGLKKMHEDLENNKRYCVILGLHFKMLAYA